MPARAGRRRLFFALWPSDEFRSEIEAATHAIAQASLRDHLSGTLSKVDEIRRSHPDYLSD